LAGKFLDRAEAINERGGGFRSEPFDSRITISGVADQREIIGNELWRDAELFDHTCFVTNDVAPLINLHDSIIDDALGEIFVRRPDADLFDLLIFCGEMCGCCQRIVRFEFDRWPNDNSHCSERVFEWMKLREQSAIDSHAGFVARPKIVPERFDDVIGGDTDVRRAVLKHLDNHAEDAVDSAERRISFVETTQTVELAKQFVGAVDEMNDHEVRTACGSGRAHFQLIGLYSFNEGPPTTAGVSDSLSGLISSLGVTLQLRGIEIDFAQVASGVSLRLVVEMLRRRIPAFTAGGDCDRAHLGPELNHSDEAVAARAVNLLRTFVWPRGE